MRTPSHLAPSMHWIHWPQWRLASTTMAGQVLSSSTSGVPNRSLPFLGRSIPRRSKRAQRLGWVWFSSPSNFDPSSHEHWCRGIESMQVGQTKLFSSSRWFSSWARSVYGVFFTFERFNFVKISRFSINQMHSASSLLNWEFELIIEVLPCEILYFLVLMTHSNISYIPVSLHFFTFDLSL